MSLAKHPAQSINIGAGTAHIGARHGVCIVAFRGTLTLPLYLEAAYRTAKLIETADCTAIYTGVDKALIAMSDDDLKLAFAMVGPAARARLKIPGALVAAEIVGRLARAYTWHAAQQGIERKAFLKPDEGWRWALTRARETRTLRFEEQSRPGFVPSARIAL